jgi:hypothetical protein
MIAMLAVVGCLMGAGQFTAPSAACTPGAYEHLSVAAACTPKDRPSLPAAERRKILHRYGLISWSGAMGELDHRQPFWSGGYTNAVNVWPQRGLIPNLKDRLEAYVRRRVCDRKPQPMMLRTAHAIFAADWRAAFFYYGLDRP